MYTFSSLLSSKFVCRKLLLELQSTLSNSRKRPVAILVDGVDLVEDGTGRANSEWIPQQLPQVGIRNVHIQEQEFCLDNFSLAHWGITFLHVPKDVQKRSRDTWQYFFKGIRFWLSFRCQGICMVMSVTSNAVLLQTLAKKRNAVQFVLGQLTVSDRKEIVVEQLDTFGKKLSDSAFNNQVIF